MGLIKEYLDRAVQTEADIVPSPYADPAVVLAAPLVTCRGFGQETHTGHHTSISASSPTGSVSVYAAPRSPVSPVLAPVVSRRASRRKHARYPLEEIANRRIVSMPENKSDILSALSHSHDKRVVSMPDRVRPALEPSAELFHSTSTAAGESFGSYGGRRERVHVFRAPSDVPQTPSPPSSPESLLIIATGTQLPEGFLRRKYSPEPLIEEDEDWITWASSPPRPIPALHGPLSLPYARCPSGAEGTIIEEPDNVAQMIWGLGPDDQPHSQIRIEGPNPHPDNPLNASSHGSNPVLPRLQKKKTSAPQQVPKLSRVQSYTYTGHAKQSIALTQRQTHDEKNGSLSQVSSDIEAHQDFVTALAWNEGQSMLASMGALDNPVNDVEAFSADNNRILEWQFARLRQALRTSFTDMDSYSAYPGRLEPVIPTTVTPGHPQAYPRIFVEPRPNELVGPAARQTSIEIAQQYRQQQLLKQALQKQKLQVQNILPTPPNSSSPQWSSHFSPYSTYCSTFSPELVGSTEHPIPVAAQKYRSGSNASQYLHHVYDRHQHDNANRLNTNTNSSANAPQIVPNVNSTASLRQSSSASTLAKYIKQLQALSPIAQFSSLQSVPLPSGPLPPLPATDESIVDTLRSVYQSPVVHTPPSPESPQYGFSYHNARSMPPARPMQRHLSSLPEEDSALLESSTPVYPPRLQNDVTTDGTLSSHYGRTGHSAVTRKSDLPGLPEADSNLGGPSIALHETLAVKVRLPATKGYDIGEQASRCHEPSKEGRQYGHRRKHRYKKTKGLANVNEQEPTRGLVG